MSSVRSIVRLRSLGARIARALLLLAGAGSLAAGLAGCASEAKLLQSDPSFTAPSLAGGGVAVLGIVKPEEVEQVRPPLIAALETELVRARPDLRVMRAERVAKRAGLALYRRTLNSFQARGRLDTTEVRSLAGVLGDEARYAVAGRVISDALRNSERGIPSQDSSRYRLFNTLLVTGRDARVEMHVYDLGKGTMVYRAQYAGSAEESRPARHVLEAAAAGGGVTIGVGPRDPVPAGVPDSLAEQWDRYPEPPPLASALAQAFRSFAEALPR